MGTTLKLTVGGLTYTVKGDGDQQYVNELGNELEAKMARFARQNPTLSTTMVAILAALDFCEEAKLAKQEVERLKKELSYTLQDPFQMRIDET